MAKGRRISRCRFIAQTAGTALGALGLPYIVPSSVLGQAGGVAPSNKITMGCIGVGWQGGSNLGSFLRERDCQVIAVCDIDKNHLQDAANSVNGRYKNKDCATYADFRELLARDDIDTVSLGKAMRSPWHL